MMIHTTEAISHLDDLVRRAQAGEEIMLTTRDGQSPVRLVPVDWETIRERRRRALDEFRGILKGKPGMEGVTAANITDDLYDEFGLPK